jgi:DNA-binding NarL/FixJ family response regulator
VNGRLRIFLVDDHEVVRAGTRALLANDFDIIGEADNVESAVELIVERCPDLVVLDVHLPGGGGGAVVGSVRAKCPDTKFMALTVSTTRADVLRLLAAGVDGYVTKSTQGVDLVDLVRATADGAKPISPEVAGYLLDIDSGPVVESSIARLTRREREVVHLIARGFTYSETAHRLGISVKTLENHMANIFHKLSVHSRHQLASLLYESGFLRPLDVET